MPKSHQNPRKGKGHKEDCQHEARCNCQAVGLCLKLDETVLARDVFNDLVDIRHQIYNFTV